MTFDISLKPECNNVQVIQKQSILARIGEKAGEEDDNTKLLSDICSAALKQWFKYRSEPSRRLI